MNKEEFLSLLREGLSGLPKEDAEDRIGFYCEMIDDRIEEGLSEEEAVREMGDADAVISQIVADTPLVKIVKEKIKKKRRLKVWEILLIAVGSPVWVPILISLIAAAFSVYVSVWSVIISLWAVFASIIGSAVGVAAAGIIFICLGDVFLGITSLSAGVVCAGLSILVFFGCKAATRGLIWLTKKFAIWLKGCFIKKEEVL